VEVSPKTLREGMADLNVWMTVNATAAQIEAVRSAIEQSTLVKRFAFADKEVALETFGRVFRDQPNLVKNVDAESLPTSFRIVSRSCSARADIATAFEQLAGVDEVSFSPGYTRKDAALLGSKNEPYLRGRGRCPKPQR
jgi:cell division protein FtsX